MQHDQKNPSEFDEKNESLGKQRREAVSSGVRRRSRVCEILPTPPNPGPSSKVPGSQCNEENNASYVVQHLAS